MDKNSLCFGLLIGRQIAGQAQKKTIAYLYNGVRFQPMPEWDKEAYPYICIYMYYDGIGYEAVASEVPLTVNNLSVLPVEKGPYIHSLGIKVSYLKWNSPVLPDWGGNPQSKHQNWNSVCTPIWANYDVYYKGDNQIADGTLFLSASDPVPVYK